ncbi:ABC transporter ATP-binding protein [Streptomyces caniscabiei]|uniref:ABC transporter ATP-binding protein n=2 Tax=Streptomyces caniscabiei TaxID=2746961 RepID=UPI0029B451A6|nr:ABC transporter ATP-binding protein [Streptomyces caniscabiei]MDX2599015.1 ABC transporter ATP-binding protein [Streptomyces caniscabiei]MDX2736485.1 ABC transporter ATP-binding protein [Streptomyces caniscabiei]
MGNREARGLLRSTLRTRRRQFVRLAGWSLVQAVPALLSGLLVARAVDDGFLADRVPEGLGWLGLLAVATLIGAWGTQQTTLRLADVVEPFRDDLVALVTTGTLRRSARLGRPSDTAGVARLTEQVEIARESYGAVVMFVQTFGVTAVSVLFGLTALDPALLLFVVPPLAVGLALFLAALRAMAARQRAVVLADEAIAEQAGTVADALRDVTACGAEHVVRDRVDTRIDAAAGAARALARLTALRTAALGIGGWLPFVLILAGAPWLLRGGVTTGAILGALTYLSQSLQPALQNFVRGVGGSGLWLLVTTARILETTTAGRTWTTAEAGAGAEHDRTGDGEGPDGGPEDGGVQDDKPVYDATVQDGTRVRDGTTLRDGAVELRGVTFGYARSAEPVVRDLDLTLAPGTHLAVVGPSGAGKSTLAALIAGVLEPQTGQVRLGGYPVRSPTPNPNPNPNPNPDPDPDPTPDPRRLARSRVLIPQEAYVFTGTLRENLTYLHPTATPADLDAAVDAIGAAPLTERLGGYDATVDPALLSAGERQLIALVRAVLPPARLVLLDEATCHLDPAAEAVAERAFAARPATLVVCAHRISSALRADLILVLDGPRHHLGTHDHLMADCALYRDLIGHWDPMAPTRTDATDATDEADSRTDTADATGARSR